VNVLRPTRSVATISAPGNSLKAINEPIVVTMEETLGDEHTEAFLDVYTWEGSNKRLVTAIEVLSWSNKTRGNPGRELYAKKQRELLASNANLLEVDLLRKGEHVTAVPWEVARQRCGDFDYHVCTHRFDRPRDFFLHPIRITDPLPTILVPLLPEHGSTALDLQAAFTTAYDTGSFRREVGYRAGPPDIALLTETQVEWARAQLRAALGDVRW
jgi:hypothetical protein